MKEARMAGNERSREDRPGLVINAAGTRAGALPCARRRRVATAGPQTQQAKPA